MCGRFASAVQPSAAWLELLKEWPSAMFSRYNVSPGSQIGAFVDGDCHAMRWGLVPSWSHEISNKYATFNARIEGIASKPAFRNAWRHNRKCLIPALGYYEWQQQGEYKQPYFVTVQDTPLVFAGLWDTAQIGDGELKSCTIITAESVANLAELHPRMPVMLDVEAARSWLSATDDSTDFLLNENRAARGDAFSVFAVDRRVNRSSEEGEDLVAPI
jgi:putative SOS response-associated peptidase YedK